MFLSWNKCLVHIDNLPLNVTHNLLCHVVLGPRRRVEEPLAVAPLEEDGADGPDRVLALVVEEQVLWGRDQ